MYKVSSFYFQPCICGECLVLCHNWTRDSASLSNDTLGVRHSIVRMHTDFCVTLLKVTILEFFF
jgi:hypothetical protein